MALDRLGLAPERVLYCGDTVLDAEAAQRAGWEFAAVLNGTTPASAFDVWPHVFLARDLDAGPVPGGADTARGMRVTVRNRPDAVHPGGFCNSVRSGTGPGSAP